MAMKACPICRMEQSDENQTCQACGAVFDNSPLGATPGESEPPKGGPDASLEEQAEAGDVDAQAALAEKESETE